MCSAGPPREPPGGQPPVSGQSPGAVSPCRPASPVSGSPDPQRTESDASDFPTLGPWPHRLRVIADAGFQIAPSSVDSAPKCAGMIPSAPELGTLWAHTFCTPFALDLDALGRYS